MDAMTTLFADFSSIRWLSLTTAAVIPVCIFAAHYAGRRFPDVPRSREATQPALAARSSVVA